MSFSPGKFIMLYFVVTISLVFNVFSRKNSYDHLDSKPGMKSIDDLVFNTDMKTANGCNAAEIFTLVAMK